MQFDELIWRSVIVLSLIKMHIKWVATVSQNYKIRACKKTLKTNKKQQATFQVSTYIPNYS